MSSVTQLVSRPSVRAAAAGTMLVLGGLLTGMVLARIGAMFGPAAVVAPLVLYVVVSLALDRSSWGIGVLVLALPVGMVALPPTPFQVVELAAGGAIALVVLGELSHGRAPLAWSPALGWVLALFGLAVVATTRAADFTAATSETIKLGLALLLVMATLAAVARVRDLRFVVVTLLIVGAAICAYGLQGFSDVSSGFGGAVIEGRSRGIFAQPNELGTFSAMIATLAAGVWSTVREGRLRRIALVCGAVAAGALIASLSRGSWIGTGLALLVIAVLQPQARRAYLTLAVPLILGAASLFVFAAEQPQVVVVRERFESFGDPTGNPYDDRPAIYREALRQIGERPLTGFGPAGFPVASSRRIEQGNTVGAHHAHNTLLAVATELGLLAVAVVVGFTLTVASSVRNAVRVLRAERLNTLNGLLTGAAAGVVVIVGQGIVDYSLRNPILYFTAWLLVGLTLTGIRLTARAVAWR